MWLFVRKLCAVLLAALLFSGCSPNEQKVFQFEAVDCDAAVKRCELNVEGKSVALTLSSGLVPLKPFEVMAEIAEGQTVEKVIIDFQMVGMDMGINRYLLSNKGGNWHGTATLPVCTVSRTDWMAIMEFSRDGKAYRVSFPFSSQ